MCICLRFVINPPTELSAGAKRQKLHQFHCESILKLLSPPPREFGLLYSLKLNKCKQFSTLRMWCGLSSIEHVSQILLSSTCVGLEVFPGLSVLFASVRYFLDAGSNWFLWMYWKLELRCRERKRVQFADLQQKVAELEKDNDRLNLELEKRDRQLETAKEELASLTRGASRTVPAQPAFESAELEGPLDTRCSNAHFPLWHLALPQTLSLLINASVMSRPGNWNLQMRLSEWLEVCGTYVWRFDQGKLDVSSCSLLTDVKIWKLLLIAAWVCRCPAVGASVDAMGHPALVDMSKNLQPDAHLLPLDDQFQVISTHVLIICLAAILALNLKVGILKFRMGFHRSASNVLWAVNFTQGGKFYWCPSRRTNLIDEVVSSDSGWKASYWQHCF